MVKEDQLRPQNHFITNVADIIGMRPVSGIQAGQQITSRMIETPPVVEKGNRVTIRAENHEIKLVTLGHVLEDGRAGDQIRVKNVGSGKEIIATVVGPGVVEVYF
jgi:flagella basal body P-ring formation protein FlgA